MQELRRVRSGIQSEDVCFCITFVLAFFFLFFLYFFFFFFSCSLLLLLLFSSSLFSLLLISSSYLFSFRLLSFSVYLVGGGGTQRFSFPLGPLGVRMRNRRWLPRDIAVQQRHMHVGKAIVSTESSFYYSADSCSGI